MKHIKTPVRMGELTPSIWEGDALLCHVGSGDADSYRKANEITLVLNERDDVIAQRDALAAAAHNARDILFEWFPDEPDDVRDKRVVIRELDAALALVRGEGEQ